MKYLILDNIRSQYNVGAIFRTADAAGVAKIFLVGYTPAPIDRFGRPVPELEKTSLGATKSVPWESVSDTLSLVKCLQADGVTVVAVELTPTSISLYDFDVPENVAYIVGNEIDGVSPVVLEAVDTVVEIPMAGMKESLNVSVATGIILYAR